MNILITNDDGIHASGMIPFAKWASKLGNVTIIAPKTEQSAKSHSIELRDPFEVEELSLISGIRAVSVASTPADCVRFAVLGREPHFDLVLSGINRGYNVGQDIIYSGTVSAATEGAYLGIPSIAISTDVPYYDDGGVFKHLDSVWEYFCRHQLLEKHCLYNVNIAPNSHEFFVTCQGGPYYSDTFPCKCGKLYQAEGRCVYEEGTDMLVDTNCVMHGGISVSPLSIDRTDTQLFHSLQGLN